MSTLIKADAHGVVESLEDRALLLKQYVREAELEVDRKKATLEALREDEKRLADAIGRADEECRALDEDVALALAGGKEDLARFAIRRLLPRKKEAAALRAQLEERSGEVRALGERLVEQESQLDELRTRVRAELARGAEITGENWLVEPVVADEEVELELLRRRAGAEGGR
ncbi:MAG: PspA/IM30 family protein [Candidatus Binatia bacterium]